MPLLERELLELAAEDCFVDSLLLEWVAGNLTFEATGEKPREEKF